MISNTSRRVLFSVLIALPLLAGCGQKAEDDSGIPITTASEEARESFIQGREAMEVDRREDARAAFDKAIEADPTFAIAYLYRARLSNSPQEWKKFTDLAQQHKATASEGEQLLIEMIPLYIKSDREMVLTQAQKLAAAYPKSPYAHLEVVYALQGLNKTTDARNKLETIIEMHPDFAPAYRALSSSFVFDDPTDYQQAETYANSYVKMKSGEASAHILLGDVYRAQVQLEKARDAYAKAAEVDPSHPIAYSKKGHANTFLGSYDLARSDFEQAMNHSEGTMKISGANFGVYSYIYAGDLAAALQANAAVMESIPGMISDEAQQRQAKMICAEDRCKIAAAAGDFETAWSAFNTFAALQREITAEMAMPEFTSSTEAELAELQGWVSAKAGDFEKAGTYADAAAEHLASSKDPRKLESVHFLKGFIALQQDDANAALEHFSQSNQDWITVKFYSAKAQEALGNADKAQTLYREVADWNFNSLDYALIRNEALAKV